MARRRKSTPTPKVKHRLRPLSQTAVMQATFDLAKELSLEMREEELVTAFAKKLSTLLPERLLCLRVVDPRTLQVRAMVTHGRCDEKVRSQSLYLKASAVKRTHLPDEILTSGRVKIVDENKLVMRGSNAGFAVPLVASRQLFGLLNVEYSDGQDLSEMDEPVIIMLANQLSVALHNLSLLGEARYLRDYLRQVIDVANALIIVIDRNGRVVVMNRAMQKFLDLDARVIGTSVETLDTSDLEHRLAPLLLAGLSGREHIDGEVTLARDGAAVATLFNTSILRSADGAIEGVIGVGQDLQRVRQLERQIIQTEKLATLGQLAAGVVHELNNPLTSITVYGSYLEKLLSKGGQAEDREKAQRIVDGAARIQKLTRDLTSYSRPAGEFERVSLNDVVRQALSFCEHVVKSSEAVLEVAFSEGLPSVMAIPAQLHQVLINLITNACHALPVPGLIIEVRTGLSPTGDSICVEVCDHGVGIDKLDSDHIFEPFFTTKKDGKGTGLGLSIVKNIVEAHGGRITFDSRPGEGTTFLIMLPAALAEAASQPKRKQGLQ